MTTTTRLVFGRVPIPEGIELRDVVYFISIIVFFLILNAAVLDKTAES